MANVLRSSGDLTILQVRRWRSIWDTSPASDTLNQKTERQKDIPSTPSSQWKKEVHLPCSCEGGGQPASQSHRPTLSKLRIIQHRLPRLPILETPALQLPRWQATWRPRPAPCSGSTARWPSRCCTPCSAHACTWLPPPCRSGSTCSSFPAWCHPRPAS